MMRRALLLLACLLVALPSLGQQTSGSATLVVGPVVSLLNGCTPATIGTASCPTPTGWTLVVTQNFESGTLPSNQSYAAGFNNSANGGINSINPHTGTKSLQGLYGSDGDVITWQLNAGQVDPFNELYISYWDYLDSTGRGYKEMYILRMKDPTSGQEVSWDYICGFYCQNSGYNWTVGGLVQVSAGDAPGGQPNYDWNLPSLALNLGTWRQYEIHFKPNTSTGGVANNDGVMELFVNGQLVARTVRNTNGIFNMQGTYIQVAGVYTAIANINPDSSCNFTTGAGTTQVRCNPFRTCAPCPIPPTFNRFIDDIIVLKK